WPADGAQNFSAARAGRGENNFWQLDQDFTDEVSTGNSSGRVAVHCYLVASTTRRGMPAWGLRSASATDSLTTTGSHALIWSATHLPLNCQSSVHCESFFASVQST